MAEGGVFAAVLGHETLGGGAGGFAVHRAAAFHHRRGHGGGGAGYFVLPRQHQRPNNRKLTAGQPGDRGKTADAPLAEKVHVEGFHGVVQVVAEGNLVAAQALRPGVQGAPAHFGAQGAGVCLAPHLEDERPDVRAKHGVGNAGGLEEGGKGAVVGILPGKAGVQREGLHGEGMLEVGGKTLEGQGEGYAVLPAGDADANRIARGEHAIQLHGLAAQSLKALHFGALNGCLTHKYYYINAGRACKAKKENENGNRGIERKQEQTEEFARHAAADGNSGEKLLTRRAARVIMTLVPPRGGAPKTTNAKPDAAKRIDREETEMSTTLAKPAEVKRSWYVIDAAGKPLGRVASQAAVLLRGKHKPSFTPHVDGGDHVIIVNCDKAVLTGAKLEKKIYYHHSGWIGGLKEVKYGKLMAERSDFAMMKAVKGMLPHNSLGAEMLKRLRVYKGAEHKNQAQKPQAYTL